MSLNYDEVAQILNMVNASSCGEFILETDSIKLTIRRGTQIDPDQFSTQHKISKKMDQMPIPLNTAEEATPVKSVKITPDEGSIIVRAPMVGTFYSCPSPDEPPFVTSGQKVTSEQTLCLLEVMKLFTPVSAGVDGTIKSILVADGALVEFDQPIIEIEKS